MAKTATTATVPILWHFKLSRTEDTAFRKTENKYLGASVLQEVFNTPCPSKWNSDTESINPSSAPGDYSCPGIYSRSASGDYSSPSEEVTVYFQ